jgi:hypothetical protein
MSEEKATDQKKTPDRRRLASEHAGRSYIVMDFSDEPTFFSYGEMAVLALILIACLVTGCFLWSRPPVMRYPNTEVAPVIRFVPRSEWQKPKPAHFSAPHYDDVSDDELATSGDSLQINESVTPTENVDHSKIQNKKAAADADEAAVEQSKE